MSRPDPLIPTVFHNRWWLEAATGGDYKEVNIQSNGTTIAWFPYVTQRKFSGHTLCTMPEMTHFLGPAIDCGSGSAPNRALRQFQLIQELLAGVKSFDGFYQKLHGGIGDTLAFEDAGCDSYVQFTYEIRPQPEFLIWNAMRDKTRNVIRRAEERSQVVVMYDPEAFTASYEANLRSRGLINYYPRMAALCTASLAHGQGQILGVKSSTGSVLAAIFLVWDHHTTYYRLATRAPYSDNGVVSLLIWNAIRNSAAAGRVFDFDGLGTPGSRLFFTGFGGQIVPRYVAARYSWSYRVAQWMKATAARPYRIISPRRPPAAIGETPGAGI